MDTMIGSSNSTRGVSRALCCLVAAGLFAWGAASRGQDPLEPNDETGYDLGTVLGAGNEWSGLSIHDSADVDWFVFTTSEAGGAEDAVSIQFAHSAGDLDMGVYDGNGEAVGVSQSSDNNESVSLDGLPAGRYYVYVFGYSGSTNPDYTLTIDAPGGASGDALEPNDESPHDLGTLTGHGNRWSGLSIHSDQDVDWFQFTTLAEGGGEDAVSILFASADGDLDLAVYNAAAQLVAASQSTGDSEAVSLSGLAAGMYYIYVYGFEGAVNPSYNLVVDAPLGAGGDGDAFEPNDSAAAASDLQTLEGHGNQWAGLSVHAADNEDWYRFTTTADGAPGDALGIVFSHAAGDLDIALFDAEGNPVGDADSASDDEIIDLTGMTAGTYYVAVFGYAGATNPAYALFIDAPFGESGAAGDELEPNNSADAPRDLRALEGHGHEWTGLSIHTADDQDWYRFTTTAPGVSGDAVGIAFVNAAGDLDMALYDGAFELVGSSTSTGNTETIRLAGLAAGTYYIAVYGYDSATNPAYDLQVDAPFNASGGTGDELEPNDTADSPRDLRTLDGHGHEWTGLSIHEAGNEDWYRFTTTAAGVSGDAAAIEFVHASGDLDIGLYDAQKTLLDASASTSNAESISLAGVPAGTYLLRVYGYEDATNPSYTLIIDAPFGQSGSSGDEFEPNDTPNAASDLRTLNGHGHEWTGLSIHEADNLDWYQFTTTATGMPDDSLAIVFQHAAGDLDIGLFESDGETQLDVSTSTNNNEVIGLDGVPAGTYLLLVMGYDGATNPSYDLFVDAPFGAPTEGGDAFEPNQTAETAGNLRTLAGHGHEWANLTLHESGDEDWFRFTTVGDGTREDYVEIAFAADAGNLGLQLLDADGAVLGTSNGLSGREVASLEGLVPATYLIRVFGTDQATHPNYTLRIEAPLGEAGAAGEIRVDWAEENDTSNTACDLRVIGGEVTFDELTMDDSDSEAEKVDWFSFTLNGAGVAGHEVAMTFSHAQGDLDIWLFDSDFEQLQASTSASDDESISLEGVAPGTYYLAVAGYNGATNPSYILRFNAPSDQIRPDSSEPNDDSDHAFNLRELSGGGNRWERMTIHEAGEEDWYRFSTRYTGTSTGRARIEFNHAVGDLQLQIYNAAGQVLGTSAGSTDGEAVSLNGLAAGTYFLRVYADGDHTSAAYTLVVDAPVDPDAAANRAWTVLVYIDGDNNLEGAGVDDVNEMEAVNLPDNVTVGVLLDRMPGYDSSNGNWTDTRRGVITHDSNTATMSTDFSSLGELNMGDPQTLYDFVAWGVQNYPAQNYALVLWDHGGGLSGVCWDDTDGHDNLSLREVRETVESTTSDLGIHFSLIGFDVCLQHVFEQAYDLRNYTDVMVASQQLEPGDGWDYTAWLGELARDPHMDAEELGSAIVTSYANFYGNLRQTTLSATRASGIDTLGTRLDELADAILANATSADWEQISLARNRAAEFEYSSNRDLLTFLDELASSSAGSSITTAAQAALTAGQAAVIANHSATGAGGRGICAYLPAPNSSLDGSYTAQNYEWVADTSWRQFAQSLADTRRRSQVAHASSSIAGNDLQVRAENLYLLSGAGRRFANLGIGAPGESDWFRFRTPAPGQADSAVGISFLHSEGDLLLELYDADSNLLASSDTKDNDEAVSLHGLPAGEFFVRVAGADDRGNPHYDLVIDAPSGDNIPEDWAERNDAREQAYLLESPGQQTVRFVGLTMDGTANEPERRDWFRIDLNRRFDWNPTSVAIEFDNSLGNLDLYAYDAQGRMIRASETDRDGEVVSLEGTSSAVYLEVRGRDNATNPAYDLIAGLTADMERTLTPGWNLLSLPFTTYSTFAELFAERQVYWWDAEVQDYRARYDGETDTLDGESPKPGIAYWIEVHEGDGATVVIEGYWEDTLLRLHAGWNLVGSVNPWLPESLPLDNQLLQQIWTWTDGNTPVTVFQPGVGVWVFCHEAVSLDISGNAND